MEAKSPTKTKMTWEAEYCSDKKQKRERWKKTKMTTENTNRDERKKGGHGGDTLGRTQE